MQNTNKMVKKHGAGVYEVHDWQVPPSAISNFYLYDIRLRV